jgi:chromatin structure-remodeling complex subunit RSC1/2
VQAIPEPRSINGIKTTLQNNQYKMAEDVYEDLTLVMLNAEFYNEEGSQIWKDADTLKVSLNVAIPLTF